VLILKVDKVLCFDTVLQVFILKKLREDDPCSVIRDPWKSGAEEVDSRQVKVERKPLEETPRPVRKLRPMRELDNLRIRVLCSVTRDW
jgi:hypothetical protein